MKKIKFQKWLFVYKPPPIPDQGVLGEKERERKKLFIYKSTQFFLPVDYPTDTSYINDVTYSDARQHY